MLKKVERFIREKALFTRGQHLLVGVSGGADSVCMLHILKDLAARLDLTLTVAHLNHCIRGGAADKDAEFVKKLAGSLGIPFVAACSDVPGAALRGGISIEMAARKARYAFFKQVARKRKADVVVTAHTADDQAETVVLNLARGTGRRGLSGIPAEIEFRGLKVARPMLCVTRDEITAFLRKRGLSWREDESNDDLSFLRNSVRHEVLPLLKSKLNPQIRRTLLKTAEVLGEEDRWLDCLAEEMLKTCMEKKALNCEGASKLSLAARRRVIMLWLVKAGVSAEAIDFDVVSRVDILLTRKRGTGMTDISAKKVVRREYGHMLVEKRKLFQPTCGFCETVSKKGVTMVLAAGLRVEVVVEPGLVKPCRGRAGDLPAGASIRQAAVGRKKVVVRSYRPGDRMKPLGMKGSKKLHDILVDQKIPRDKRSGVPVFECGGEIIWLPGYNVARGWEVVDETELAYQFHVERI